MIRSPPEARRRIANVKPGQFRIRAAVPIGLKNKHVECSLQQLDSVLILASSFIDVDTLLALGVECLLPRHGGASIQSRAYSNSSDEIGIRPDIPVEAVRCVAC